MPHRRRAAAARPQGVGRNVLDLVIQGPKYILWYLYPIIYILKDNILCRGARLFRRPSTEVVPQKRTNIGVFWRRLAQKSELLPRKMVTWTSVSILSASCCLQKYSKMDVLRGRGAKKCHWPEIRRQGVCFFFSLTFKNQSMDTEVPITILRGRGQFSGPRLQKKPNFWAPSPKNPQYL